MYQDSERWLSKAHPPKSLVKPSPAAKQKGPLSRRMPPRRMIMSNNNSGQNLYASYLTQNSPPPGQLLTATKQTTLGYYFSHKEDKCQHKEVLSVNPVTKKTRLTPSTCELEAGANKPLQARGQDNAEVSRPNKPLQDNTNSPSNEGHLQPFLQSRPDMYFKKLVSGCLEVDWCQGDAEDVCALRTSDCTVAGSASACSCDKENVMLPKINFKCQAKQDEGTGQCFDLGEETLFTVTENCSGTTHRNSLLTFSEGLNFLSQSTMLNAESKSKCEENTDSLKQIKYLKAPSPEKNVISLGSINTDQLSSGDELVRSEFDSNQLSFLDSSSLMANGLNIPDTHDLCGGSLTKEALITCVEQSSHKDTRTDHDSSFRKVMSLRRPVVELNPELNLVNRINERPHKIIQADHIADSELVNQMNFSNIFTETNDHTLKLPKNVSLINFTGHAQKGADSLNLSTSSFTELVQEDAESLNLATSVFSPSKTGQFLKLKDKYLAAQGTLTFTEEV